MKKRLQNIVLGALVLALVLSVAGCGGAATPPASTAPSAAPAQSMGDAERYVNIEITMEDGGVMKLTLDRQAAPITVENFVSLVEQEFYDGLIFHRVIADFMIQGGDPEGTGMGGSENTIKGEFSANGWDNPIAHTRGVISMARGSNDMDSASSQFFIVRYDNDNAHNLDGQYAAFGTMTEGFDVLDNIATVATGENDRPLQPPVIATIRVVE